MDGIKLALVDWMMRKLDQYRQSIVWRMQQKLIKQHTVGLAIEDTGQGYVIKNVSIHQLTQLKHMAFTAREYGYDTAFSNSLATLADAVREENHV
jgi:oligoribonuclease NrnB/cAMP/cGMP phosphodiesterase (DHH superfamily)